MYINRILKKVLVSGISLLMVTSLGSGISNVSAHRTHHRIRHVRKTHVRRHRRSSHKHVNDNQYRLGEHVGNIAGLLFKYSDSNGDIVAVQAIINNEYSSKDYSSNDADYIPMDLRHYIKYGGEPPKGWDPYTTMSVPACSPLWNSNASKKQVSKYVKRYIRINHYLFNMLITHKKALNHSFDEGFKRAYCIYLSHLMHISYRKAISGVSDGDYVNPLSYGRSYWRSNDYKIAARRMFWEYAPYKDVYKEAYRYVYNDI